MAAFINTDRVSVELRKRGIDVPNRRVLVTKYEGSLQAKDLAEPPNCDGLGRIRHFGRQRSGERWSNPLPLDPAQRALDLPRTDNLRAQVFQNAVCNWRCWYCYVDFELLSANMRHARWTDADELVELYQRDGRGASIIDVSGGQPDLTPEWIVWMMEALERADIAHLVYLWSDDNLSNDYLWKFLTRDQLDKLANYPMYGRVACFKGIDAESFAFNTLADPQLFNRQFELFDRLLNLGIDLYAYVTFTVPSGDQLKEKVTSFIDRLQSVHENLPLRTVPLRIHVLTPTVGRMTEEHAAALRHQEVAIDIWHEELSKRFAPSLRSGHISGVSMSRK